MGMKIALLQMMVTADKETNLKRAEELVKKAAQGGADMAVLPEMFNCPYDNAYFREYAEPKGGETYIRLAGMAKEHAIYVVGGSIPQIRDNKIYNTSYTFDRQGNEIHDYSKNHLFDIQVEGGQVFRESDTLTPGDGMGVFETEFGLFGLGICFDVRFQSDWELLQKQGALVCIVPGAFNMTTGPAHWELLFRARAVDNQLFMVGVSPARDLDFSYHAYGHSLVADPWGSVLAQLGFEEDIAIVSLDLERVASIRRQLPILTPPVSE
ncbi:Predicted amidohydrolase [Trichococcus flocculiformis]|nr:carbon-nitrogen hydrolase [Trichococcus sp. ES5]SHF26615.1 Predicted amidohydrolase [Trichococcus flocculiformis]